MVYLPFLKFLEPRLNKTLNVFEYGSGNSTIWYAERVNSIKAVEHDEEWAKKIKPKLPKNSSILFQNLEGEFYARSILLEKINFNIVVIDGVDRNNCTKYCVKNLTEDGVIIFDNSNRDEYNESFSFLALHNFRRLDFWGMCPIVTMNSCTSVFYRSINCLKCKNIHI